MAQVNGPSGAEGERLAQRLAHPLGSETEDDHLSTLLLGDLQRRLEGDFIALVDRERQILFVDPAAILGDPQARLGVRNLLDADGNFHLGSLPESAPESTTRRVKGMLDATVTSTFLTRRS